jgi:polysaccharide pyruvyl transferase WcaK-like protein
LILAAGVGTPVAGLAYDPKVACFARDIYAPVFPIEAEHDEEVRALQAFVDDPRLDVEAVARLRSRAAAGLRWLCREALHPSLEVGA